MDRKAKESLSVPNTPYSFKLNARRSPTMVSSTPSLTPSRQRFAAQQASCSLQRLHRGRSKSHRQSPSSHYPGSASDKSSNIIIGDRFIPSRRGTNMELCRRTLFSPSSERIQNFPQIFQDEQFPAKQYTRKQYHRTMLSTLCNVPIDSFDIGGTLPSSWYRDSLKAIKTPHLQRMFQYSSSPVSTSQQNRNNTNSFRRSIIPHQDLRLHTSSFDFRRDRIFKWSSNNVLATGNFNSILTVNMNDDDVFEWADFSNDINVLAWCEPNNPHLLAVGMDEGMISIYDANANKIVRSIEQKKKLYTYNPIHGVAWNPQRRNIFFSCNCDGEVYFHDLRSKDSSDFSRALPFKGYSDCFWGLQVDPSGTYLAASYFDRVDVFNLNSSILTCTLEHPGHMNAAAWCPARKGVLATCAVRNQGEKNSSIKLWDVETEPKLLCSVRTKADVHAIVWNDDGTELCSAHSSDDKVDKSLMMPTLKLWHHKDRYLCHTKTVKTGHTKPIYDLARHGDTVATLSSDRTKFFTIFDDNNKVHSSKQDDGVLSRRQINPDPDCLWTLGNPTLNGQNTIR